MHLSKIEWTEATWNPVTGCTKVSAGCKRCYAETLAKRLKAMGVRGYDNGFRISLLPERLDHPRHVGKPTKFFVNSMSDLFHPKIPSDYIDKVMEVITDTPRHQYQILTKRAELIEQYFQTRDVPDNAWIGVSVENKRHGVPRIDFLRKISAPVRFLSAEPLLEDLGNLNLSGLHWVIVGGESGCGARPMREEWVTNIKKRCDAAGVAFFFKQWGAWDADGVRRSKKANDRIYCNKIWDMAPSRLSADETDQ